MGISNGDGDTPVIEWGINGKKTRGIFKGTNQLVYSYSDPMGIIQWVLQRGTDPTEVITPSETQRVE